MLPAAQDRQWGRLRTQSATRHHKHICQSLPKDYRLCWEESNVCLLQKHPHPVLPLRVLGASVPTTGPHQVRIGWVPALACWPVCVNISVTNEGKQTGSIRNQCTALIGQNEASAQGLQSHFIPKADQSQAASHVCFCVSSPTPKKASSALPDLSFGYSGHTPFNENSALWAKMLLTID